MHVAELVPDAEIGLAAEELAHVLLQLAEANLQNGRINRQQLTMVPAEAGAGRRYPQGREAEITLALCEAYNWLEVQGLLLPEPGVNGQNGWMLFSRKGQALLDRANFNSYLAATEFPKSLLHPAIAERVWITLARGELSVAVFAAFRQVEEAVREAGDYSDTDIGVDLMRRAFHPNDGPLSDREQPTAEREALMHLFAGAIGSYKNPHSHRTVNITDHRDAQEMVLLASHLLRIVDDRRPQN